MKGKQEDNIRYLLGEFENQRFTVPIKNKNRLNASFETQENDQATEMIDRNTTKKDSIILSDQEST